jgi:hypothetical protein
MTDDVVEHLAAINVFEEKVEMALSNDHVPHGTDIRVSKESHDCGLPDSANLAIFIFGPCGISTSRSGVG